MDLNDDESRKCYQEVFTPEMYRNVITGIMNGGKCHKEFEFMLSTATQFFQNPKYHGKTLLDIGTGPSPYCIFPAVEHFSEIVVSELTDSCRDHLKKIIYNEPGALDWSFVHRMAAKYVGYRDPEAGRLEIEDMLRRKVKAVVPCDVLVESILPVEYSVEYDAVTCSLVLNNVNLDKSGFWKTLRNISRLVKTGGYLMIRGPLDKTNSVIYDGRQCPSCNYSRKDMEEGLKQANFCNIVMKTFPKQDDFYVDFSEVYCLVAEKGDKTVY